jgi:uncharacterized protein
MSSGMLNNGVARTRLVLNRQSIVNNSRLVLVAAAALMLGLILIFGRGNDGSNKPAAKVGCQAYRVDKIAQVNQHRINLEVASSSTQLQKGLSGRNCISGDEGMLFVFNKPGHYAFWMKDMKFPIDIVWISAAHQVVGQEIDVAPSTYPDKFVNKDKPASYVLELQANRSKSLGIDLGTPISF